MEILERLYTVKRFFHTKAIKLGLFNPGRTDRHQWVGPTASADMKRDFQITFLKAHGLLPSYRLLDIGCGSLRGGIPIIRYLNAGHYWGVDVRPHVLESALDELKEHKLQDKSPALMLADEFETRAEDSIKFDIIWLFNSMIHMFDPILKKTMVLISRNLSATGICYGTVYLGKRADGGDWQGFPGVIRPLCFYEDVAKGVGLRARVIGSLDGLGYEPQGGKRSEIVMLEFVHREIENASSTFSESLS